MCRLPVGCLPQALPAASAGQGASTKQGAGGRLQHFDDEFLQFQYKVVPCSKSFRHDFATCPFAHAGESSERRHPSAYLPFLCGATQHSTDLKEKCPFATACKYAHSHFELWLHPGRFRTKMCSLGGACKRPVCFFAHSEAELRVTQYSKLDTSAPVAAQQLADMGQLLDPNTGAGGVFAGSCSSMASEAKGAYASSLGSLGNSEPGRAGSGSSSPSNSLSCDDAAALARLTASMSGLACAPAAPGLLDVGAGMARLHSSSGYLAAATAALDASLSGSADLMWPLQQQQQQQQAQQQPAAAAMGYAGPYLQAAPLQVLDPQLLGLAPAGSAGLQAGCGNELWVLAPSGAPQQWAAVPAAQQLAYNMSAAPATAGPGTAGPMAGGLPVPALLGGGADMEQWLPLNGGGMVAAKGPGSFTMGQQQVAAGMPGGQQQAMQQLLNTQAVQQLLGFLDGGH